MCLLCTAQGGGSAHSPSELSVGEQTQAVNIWEWKAAVASLYIHWLIIHKHSYVYRGRKPLPVPSLTHIGKALPVSHGPKALVLDMHLSTIYNHSGRHLLLTHLLRPPCVSHTPVPPLPFLLQIMARIHGGQWGTDYKVTG